MTILEHDYADITGTEKIDNRGMTAHKQVLVKKWLKHFLNLDGDRQMNELESHGIDVMVFNQMLENCYRHDQENEDLDAALKRVRAQIKRPRIGKKAKMFLLRHAETARKLQERGASYNEIAYYLTIEKRFKVNASYLRKLMETLI